jgi:glycosyltransferase involved in cell wall biosynthesis
MNIVQVSVGELRIPVKAGAVEVIILSLSKELVKMGHNVTIIDRKYSKEDPAVEYIDGTKIVRLRSRRFPHLSPIVRMGLNQFLFALGVRRYLSRAEDVDIIHTHTSIIGLTLAMLCRNLRGKLIYTSHSARRLMDSPSLVGRLALLPENKLFKRIKKTIVLSEVARERLILVNKVKSQTVVSIPFGIDLNRFNPNLSGEGIRQRYGLEGKEVILFVGTINQRKGVEYLAKAANIVVNEFGYRNAFFLLVGPTEAFGLRKDFQTQYLAKILSLIENHGLKENVRLTGLVPQEELGNFYAACDIFVLPSFAEALPAVLLEAMACGKPVIGTKAGGIPRQIEGQSGFLIEPGNERQLAERIKYLIDNPSRAKEMGACGRKNTEGEYNWTKIVEALLQVYQGE